MRKSRSTTPQFPHQPTPRKALSEGSKVRARQAIRETAVNTVLADGTKETSNVAEPGDVIVTGVGGERWVVKPRDVPSTICVEAQREGDLYRARPNRRVPKPIRTAYLHDGALGRDAVWIGRLHDSGRGRSSHTAVGGRTLPYRGRRIRSNLQVGSNGKENELQKQEVDKQLFDARVEEKMTVQISEVVGMVGVLSGTVAILSAVVPFSWRFIQSKRLHQEELIHREFS